MTTSETSTVKKKKRMIVSYNKLTFEQLTLLRNLYPLGFTDAMMKVKGMNNEEFNAVMMETEDVQYLVKVEVGNTGVVFEDEETADSIGDDVTKGLIPDMDNESAEEEDEDSFEDDRVEIDEDDEDDDDEK